MFSAMSVSTFPRAVDFLLTMSIPGRNSTGASLVRTSFVVVLVLVNVFGFRPVLARGWHGAGPSAWEQACHLALTIIYAGQEYSALSVSDPHVSPLILYSGTQRARRALGTIWLQNTPGLSGTVAHAGWGLPARLFGSAFAGSRCGQPCGQPEALDRRFSVKTQLTEDLLPKRPFRVQLPTAVYHARAERNRRYNSGSNYRLARSMKPWSEPIR